ncbi:MAG TPA: hypothetical protein VFH31_00940, partial [Pyrinomonadaceae bacterium]|nr:hypothetical protein [Pyrinomonadaceae bacterium]
MLVSTSVSLARLSILAGTVVALALTVVRFFGDVRLRPEGLLGAGFGLVVELGSVVQGFSTTHGLIVCVSWARTWPAPSISAANMNANPNQTFLGRDFNQSPVLF